MLYLQLKSGEYLTIGDDIVIQVHTSSKVRVSVQAPKEMTILRGEVWERNGEERPECLYPDEKPKKLPKSGGGTPEKVLVSNG